MKIAKWIILGLVVVLVVAGLIVYLNLNSIVRRTVETQATDSLNLQTTLDSARVSLFGGNVSLDDLKVASPEGFSAPKMLTLDGVDVGVSFGQLRQQPMHIASLTIRKPTLVVEQSGMKLNIQSAMDQTPKPAGSSGGESKEPMKVIIDRLQVKDATVIVRGIPGLDKELSVPVPSLDLANVGTGEGNENGAAIKEVVMQLITALAAKGTDLGNLPDQIKQQINGKLQDVSTRLSGEFQKQVDQISGSLQKKLGGEVGKKIGDVIGQEAGKIDPGKAVEKGLGDILGKKDENKDAKKPTTRP